MKQIIRNATKPNIFTSFWTTPTGEVVQNGSITLDFNPIIEFLKKRSLINLNESFCIVHYQARPKNLRQYGVWHLGTYRSFRDCVRAEVPSLCVCLDESALILPPNAAIVYPRSIFDPDRMAIISIDTKTSELQA